MEQKKTGINNPPDRRLSVLGAAVAAGALAGSLLCARWEGLQAALLTYGQAPAAFWDALWPDLLLLTALLLCGFVRMGSGISLILMAVKGFLLSAVSARSLLEQGGRGYGQALCCILPAGLFSLTALLLLGRQALALSLIRQRCRKPVPPDSAYWFTFAVCLLFMTASAALTVWLSPKLWAFVQTFG